VTGVERARSWFLLLLGLALLAAYVALERELPRGPQEFVAWPPLEPLPWAPLRGFAFEQLARHIYRALLLAPAALLLALVVSRFLPARPLGPRFERALVVWAGAASLLLAAVFLFGVLGGRALLDDDLTYFMQAELLVDGKLAEPTVPPFVAEAFTIWTPRGFTGKYLFGEPLVQTAGARVGYPALLHLPLHLLVLIAWYAQVRRAAGERLAAWSTALLALSPLLVINTASALSHTTTLAGVVVAGLGWSLLSDTTSGRGERLGGAALVGAGIGWAATVRPQVALPVGAVLGAAAALSLLRQRRFGALALMAGTSGLFGAAILLYNWWLTGSAFTLPWYLYEPVEQYGFGQVLGGTDYVHDFRRALENLGVMVVRMDSWWLGWPLGILLLLLWFVVGRPRAFGSAGVWLVVGAAVVLFNLGYYSTGVSLTGPIYHFELLLPLSLLGGAAIVAGFERWPRSMAAMLLMQLMLGTATYYVETGTRLARYLELLHRAPAAALAAVDRPALLFYEMSSTENVRLGWLNAGFPWRFRSDRHPVVTYPRSGPAPVAAMRRRYADRSCWYHRVDPQTLRAETLRCEEAEDLLARPLDLEGPMLTLRSTAMIRGLLR
jgi:hypothetical protein